MIGVGIGIPPRHQRKWTPLWLPYVNHWYYAGSRVTQSGKVSALGDLRSPTSDLAQATSAQQPTFSASGGPFGGARLLYDGNVDTRIVGATAADWAFLHNATDKFFAVSYLATGGSYQVLLDTCDWSGTNVGFSLYHRGGTQAIGLQLSNGTGAQALAVESAASSVADNAAHVALVTMTSAGVYAVYVDGTSVLSGTWASTPSAAAPTYPLTIGGRASALSFDFFGKVGEVVTGTGVPDATTRARLRAFLNFTNR